jgi:hypothetical protein
MVHSQSKVLSFCFMHANVPPAKYTGAAMVLQHLGSGVTGERIRIAEPGASLDLRASAAVQTQTEIQENLRVHLVLPANPEEAVVVVRKVNVPPVGVRYLSARWTDVVTNGRSCCIHVPIVAKAAVLKIQALKFRCRRESCRSAATGRVPRQC